MIYYEKKIAVVERLEKLSQDDTLREQKGKKEEIS